MNSKQLGKIKDISFGKLEYQFGVYFTLGSTTKSWGVCDFKGHISGKRSEHVKWTEVERLICFGEMCIFIDELLTQANKKDINALIGTPVEVTFENSVLKEWRILTEVI